jgi:hypothetical protein
MLLQKSTVNDFFPNPKFLLCSIRQSNRVSYTHVYAVEKGNRAGEELGGPPSERGRFERKAARLRSEEDKRCDSQSATHVYAEKSGSAPGSALEQNLLLVEHGPELS